MGDQSPVDLDPGSSDHRSAAKRHDEEDKLIFLFKFLTNPGGPRGPIGLRPGGPLGPFPGGPNSEAESEIG